MLNSEIRDEDLRSSKKYSFTGYPILSFKYMETDYDPTFPLSSLGKVISKKIYIQE